MLSTYVSFVHRLLWSTSERSERGDHSLHWMNSPPCYYFITWILGSKKWAFLTLKWISSTKVQKMSLFYAVLSLQYYGPKNEHFLRCNKSPILGSKKWAFFTLKWISSTRVQKRSIFYADMNASSLVDHSVWPLLNRNYINIQAIEYLNQINS